MRELDVRKFIELALECSLYAAPREYGLTLDELVEVAGRLGFGAGETRDAAGNFAKGRARLEHVPFGWDDFLITEEPDFRNIDAFQAVCDGLRTVAREQGVAYARLDRAVVVARWVSSGRKERDIEVAIAILELAGRIKVLDGVLQFQRNKERYPTPHEQRSQRTPRPPWRNEHRQKVYEIVSDVVARRTDGRPPVAEALDAFTFYLDKLGYSKFRLWWTQAASELNRTDSNASPLSACVLSAALVEGGLTFIVAHARGLNLGPMGSRSFERAPNTWKLEELIVSAGMGGHLAILDANTQNRAQSLVTSRQRIHAGRMLVEHPQGIPDIRPDEAREAKATAELVVRRICDWLEAHPPTTADTP